MKIIYFRTYHILLYSKISILINHFINFSSFTISLLCSPKFSSTEIVWNFARSSQSAISIFPPTRQTNNTIRFSFKIVLNFAITGIALFSRSLKKTTHLLFSLLGHFPRRMIGNRRCTGSRASATRNFFTSSLINFFFFSFPFLEAQLRIARGFGIIQKFLRKLRCRPTCLLDAEAPFSFWKRTDNTPTSQLLACRKRNYKHFHSWDKRFLVLFILNNFPMIIFRSLDIPASFKYRESKGVIRKYELKYDNLDYL